MDLRLCGCIDSSSIIAHPIYTTGTIAKIRCQEVDISIIDRYNSFDNRYGFIVSNGNTTRHAVFPIHRINLQCARANSRSLCLTYALFSTLLDRQQSLNTFKDRPRPSRPYRSVAAHCHSVYDHCRSIPSLFLIGPDFQIGLDWERIAAQWNGGIQTLLTIFNWAIWCPESSAVTNFQITWSSQTSVK